MKRIFITSIVTLAMVVVSASVAQALTGYTFENNLTVGSTGTDVSTLQQFLLDSGYDIPALSSGVAQKGYFGSQTLAAVKLYQAASGIINTGFVGPLTRGALNGTSGAISGGGASCPAGYTCTANNPLPVVNCPVGYTCTANPGTVVTPGAPLVMDGTDGSITASLSSYASNNTIKKGETKDMVAVKLQATAAPVSVTRFDVRFNTRPWLYFSTVTLKDSTGTVIATKNLSSASDATEITVGSDYLVRFEGINVVVTPGTDQILVVSGTVLSTTDKLTSDVSVIVSVPNSSIRTINGKGYTDSLGLGTVATSGTSGRTMTLSSTGSTGNILVKLSSTSPDNRIVTTSSSGETTGVVLGKFDFKSENRTSTLNTLTFTLSNNGSGLSTMLKRVYITDGSQTVQTDAVPDGTDVASTSLVFSNLSFDLTQDEWKTITISADVADQDDFTAGTTLIASTTVNNTNIVGIDSNYTTVTATGANVVTSNTITFLKAGASVTAPVVTVTNVDNGSSAVVKKSVVFKYNFNNTGTTDLYVAVDPYRAFATSTTLAATTTTFDSLSGGSAQNQDSATVYIVPAGTSRAFTLSGVIDTTRDNSDKSGEIKITAVYFGDDTTNFQESNVNFGLDLLTSGVQTF